MTRSHAYRIACRHCRRPRDEVGRPHGDHRVLSYRGLCPDCAQANMQAELDRSANLAPDYWQRYRASVAASVGAALPPAPTESA